MSRPRSHSRLAHQGLRTLGRLCSSRSSSEGATEGRSAVEASQRTWNSATAVSTSPLTRETWGLRKEPTGTREKEKPQFSGLPSALEALRADEEEGPKEESVGSSVRE